MRKISKKILKKKKQHNFNNNILKFGIRTCIFEFRSRTLLIISFLPNNAATKRKFKEFISIHNLQGRQRLAIETRWPLYLT